MKEVMRLEEVIRKIKLSASTIWRLEKRGDFPRRFKIGNRAVGWLKEEIEKWLLDKTKGRFQKNSKQDTRGV